MRPGLKPQILFFSHRSSCKDIKQDENKGCLKICAPLFLPRQESRIFAYAKAKAQISSAVTAQLIRQYEPRREKTGLRGFRPGATQIGLYSHRSRLDT